VLETGEVRPVGSAEIRRVDVRVIAATNRDPLAAVRQGILREDLFYRLNVFHLELPPLRERREDIPILAAYFAERVSQSLGKDVSRFTPDAQVALVRYDYPGNVRELENAIQRAVVLAEDDAVTLDNLPPVFSSGGGTFLLPSRHSAGEEVGTEAPAAASGGENGFGAGYPASWSLSEVERAHIARVLADLRGNISKSALRLGISRTTLWRKMKEHGLSAEKG
jgi:DNA-binding NtrC family response regulator